MEWYVTALLMVGILIFASLLNIPIAICLGLTAFAFLVNVVGLERAGAALNTQFVEMWTNYAVMAVPLFIFMAEFLLVGGITGDLFEMASKWLRRLPGGLAVVTVSSCAVFGAMSGSSLGAIATFGTVAVPQMLKRGYDPKLATGSVCAAGALAHLIPPSVMAVLYAMLVETSPGQQLMAGFLPGFLLAGGFVGIAIVWALLNPKAAPREPSVPWRERFLVLRKIGGPLVIIVAVLGVIYTGIATVTESAAIGAFAALILAIISRRLTRANFTGSLLNATRTTSFVLLIAVAGKFFGWVMNYFTIPQHIVDMMVATNANPWLILVMIQVLYIILGMFIDPMGIMFTTVPVLYPLLQAFGFDMVWFGVLFLINMELAIVTPPLGFGLYIIKGIVPQVPLSDIIKGGLRFSVATVAVLGILMAFPQIALWLPAQMSR